MSVYHNLPETVLPAVNTFLAGLA